MFNYYIFINKVKYLLCLIRMILNNVINILVNSVKLIIYVYIIIIYLTLFILIGFYKKNNSVDYVMFFEINSSIFPFL